LLGRGWLGFCGGGALHERILGGWPFSRPQIRAILATFVTVKAYLIGGSFGARIRAPFRFGGGVGGRNRDQLSRGADWPTSALRLASPLALCRRGLAREATAMP